MNKDFKIEIKIDVLPTFNKLEGMMRVSDFKTGKDLAYSSRSKPLDSNFDLRNLIEDLIEESKNGIALRKDAPDYGIK